MSDPNSRQSPQQPYQGQPGPQQPPYGAPGVAAYAPVGPPPKKRRVWLWVLIGVLALILIFIAACTAIVGSAVNEVTKGAVPSTIPSGAATVPGGSSSQAPASNDTAKFGDTVKYDDGIAVVITKHKNGKTSKYSEHPGSPVTSFFVKVTNGTSQNLNGAYVSVDVTYGKDGSPADQVFDSTNFGDQISGTIGKGKSKTGEYSFAVPIKERGDVTVEVSFTDFDHDNAIFAGSVK